MAAGIDEDGNDMRLAEAVRRMTPEHRRQSDENIARWVERFRAGLRENDEPSESV